jgi:hypothetical protein
MAHQYDHLRAKAVQLRTEQHMTLDDIIERLKLPKTTVYSWIKDIPIPRTDKQTEAQRKKADLVRAKYALLRDQAYQKGLDEASELLQNPTFRDFVVLYMAEGYKRNRNQISFVNSDAGMVKLAHKWIVTLTANKNIEYTIQCHVDHNEEELKQYWANVVGIQPTQIKIIRKSNSGNLSGRQFRSEYGLLTVRVGDTYLRARLQAWIDIVKAQW